MAVVTVSTGERFEGEAARQYLDEHGVVLEFWSADALPEDLRKERTPSSEQKDEILTAFAGRIDDLKTKRGYKAQDVVVLNPDTPNLEAMMVNFRKEHHHEDDEVRYVIDGEGVFTINGGDFTFDILCQEGDAIVVPQGTRHWFDLTDSRRIACIRIFDTPEGWKAIY
ncbi:MAG: acireductone dioxygenase [Alphaproteobacteria bacterium CG_4_10_14_0_2_um_filter_63_37]|nr:MAG: hypothetical protein AUJ55_01125 [Proteobacteria bacterium CG1_02_64_396]PJA25818.1 MAG: acireductone dioxygenase [Alphaproteobacteria bacterium CG_4_10_14_0_2_um_filter_63_37]